MKLQSTILTLALTALLAAGCGGSSGGKSGNETNPPPPPPPASTQSGVFLDSPVQGLSYTASPSELSGTTDVEGRFKYEEGDTVSFALGELVLGTVKGQDVVTPRTVAQALVAANPAADLDTVTLNLLMRTKTAMASRPAASFTILWQRPSSSRKPSKPMAVADRTTTRSPSKSTPTGSP